jgi:hypothetical protein
MNILDEFRANAAECQRMSDKTVNVIDSALWREMADHWLYLAREPADSARPSEPAGGERLASSSPLSGGNERREAARRS